MDDKLLKEALIATFDKKYALIDTDVENVPEYKFSKKFEKKMNKLIARSDKFYFPLISTTVRRVACILVVITAFTISTLSVDAVREQFKHFFINIFNDHSEIKVNTDAMISDITKIDIESIEANIPEGFELVDSSDDDVVKLREYRNNEEFIIIYVTIGSDMSVIIDNEQYNYETYYDDNGQEYMVNNSEEEGQITVLWSNQSYIYRVTSNLNKDEILSILE